MTWSSVISIEDLGAILSQSFGKTKTWGDVEIWGDEEGTRFDVLTCEGAPYEIYLRVDVRNSDEQTLQKEVARVMPVLRKLKANLVTTADRVIYPVETELLLAIRASKAYRWSIDPSTVLEEVERSGPDSENVGGTSD